jgi:hypothetical protein
MEKKQTKEYKENKSDGSNTPGLTRIQTSSEPHGIAET